MIIFETHIPEFEVLIDKRWLVGGLAVGALGLTCALFRRWAAGGVCRCQAMLDGKTVIITGANTGIGLETAVDLAKRNARVILACRSVERGESAAVEVRKRSGNDNVVFYQLDLASLDSVRQFSAKILEEEPRIDILINNAGVMAIPKRTLTQDGFEMQFGVNHLGHFLLTNLLLDRIKEAPSARIVNVSSRSHNVIRGRIDFENLNSEYSYSPWIAYGTSKLANILFTHSLTKRLKGTCVTVNCLHPGLTSTELGRHINMIIMKVIFGPLRFLNLMKSPQQGAQTIIYCAVSEEMEGVTGKYLADCRVKNSQATDDQLAERLWEVSEKLTRVKD